MKTDSLWADGMIYSQLTTFYALLGDMEHAKNYFEKLMKLPPENIQPWVCRDLAKAVIYAGNCKWEESDRHFKKYFKWLKTNWKNSIGNEVTAKLFYAWALERQGRFVEAQAQHNESQKIRRDAEKRFEYANIQANLMAPARVRIGETFEARVDIVNVSKTPILLSSIENLLDPNLTVVRFSSDYRVQNSLVDLRKEALTPFKVKTVKLSLKAKQLGEISLAPKLVYIDDLKKTTTSVINKVTITVVPAVISAESETLELPRIKFKSDDAERALDFLIDAFREDYTKQRLPLQESGWRTLMDVVKKGQASKHSMYGRSGKGGAATLELGYLGLVESRFFRGERGRGGRILKLRIYPEKEYVKRRLIK
jgi:tetratricopeptide (TPR) repeat protein